VVESDYISCFSVLSTTVNFVWPIFEVFREFRQIHTWSDRDSTANALGDSSEDIAAIFRDVGFDAAKKAVIE
jgi:hypothetical protein